MLCELYRNKAVIKKEKECKETRKFENCCLKHLLFIQSIPFSLLNICLVVLISRDKQY